MKPKMAFFDFSSCEGCQLQFLSLEAELPDLLGLVNINNFREAKANPADDYQIAFIEGGITHDSEIPKLEKIRAQANTVIAFGACAWPGGVNCLKNRYTPDEVLAKVYGQDAGNYTTIPTRPIDAVIPVDYYIRGCPPHKAEIIEVVKSLLLGRKPFIPTYPVCVECKQAGNVCLFEKGIPCLGPVTRAGCKAWCPSYNDACLGCRGLVDNPNTDSEREVLEKYGVTVAEIMAMYERYNACPEVAP